ncbi:aspartate 1-decarboxylase [Deferribacter autotrophicus]|uniref:Aspartate 1-decarboxylase n=1 Tax=Deferribacter autotrophicus TaxID=500465 RepID=A0A5A8F787_9BACT|nr:aspartate 1-decarboxylase [Deferribacter autotrophicus]KAA0259194.1 aspartate 1-decarboxylase [Deferribacter autotrophicus]
MKRIMFKSKIHRATVTDADLHYEGSITIDKELMDAAGILPYEKVDIYNITNGARFSTYTIEGRPGSGEICLNGAAARMVQPGDMVIIVSYGLYDEEELKDLRPVVIQVDEKNRIIRKEETALV